MILVFFDLEKAYETTGKFGMMKDLHSLGLQGRLPNFIISFLLDREFRVQIWSTFSNLYKQEEGVLQGSILSVTLFNLKINNITRCLTPGIDGYLYVDSFWITSQSKYMRTAERQLQQCIQDIQKQNTMYAQWPTHKTRRQKYLSLMSINSREYFLTGNYHSSPT